MCRLFAYVAPDTSAADRELGEEGIESFLSLARLHGDGWGWAGVARTGEAPEVRKSPLSAAADPDFRPTIATAGHAAMMHLRWATLGLPVELRNAHPFRAGDVSFEHNGSLKPIERVRAMLSPEALAGMSGETDSEMYFTLIREQLAAGADLPEATARVVRRLRAAFPLSSLNAILLDGDQLVVVHASARSVLPDDDVEEIAQLGGLPDDHNEDYFALRWKRSPDGTVLISSTGVAGAGWETLPPESVTTVRLEDGTMATEALGTALPAAVTD
ncbi:class II glutamine amidotransferase [Microbacterium capsulatum]|uniref:Class II glutamine amidotransferase n=1 Tax=Microbacterium capsulatum TaxID=3041921 RepID=A0ABU0XIJ0_9MICO|nr:class II glutamine amidotransferase [Microbacterium sp. ASV81]MDQ4214936.1 class II glutamine amidotransferase [Microbacterium sp. ASV81]